MTANCLLRLPVGLEELTDVGHENLGRVLLAEVPDSVQLHHRPIGPHAPEVGNGSAGVDGLVIEAFEQDCGLGCECREAGIACPYVVADSTEVGVEGNS